MAFTWPDVLSGLVAGRDLPAEATGWAMDQILTGDATGAQIAGFVVALRCKGETVAEIAGMAEAMLNRATPIALDTEAVDIVGSGGDRANTVNVSTMAAVVAAACGARVVKHGNRAASSACGTADCLEALGIALDVAPERQARVLADAGIVFLFAPLYHPSLRHAGSTRRELGIPTTFNFLGPLANPARPRAQAVGVADARMAPLMAGVLAGRGCRGLVFHGDDGLDELTTTTTSQVYLFAGGTVVPSSLDPATLGLEPAGREALVGGDAPHNAGVVRQVFGGARGPVRDIVLMNAAAALLAYRGVDLQAPLADQLRPLLDEAARAIDAGAAAATLEGWVRATALAKRD